MQSLAPIRVSRRVDIRQAAACRKTIAESLSQYDEKHVVSTPLSGKRVGKRKHTRIYDLACKIVITFFCSK
jgi:hypothetical protein